MMKQINLLLLHGLAALLSAGCTTCGGEIEPCADVSIPVESLEKLYGCSTTRRELQSSLVQTYAVIRSQSEFDQKVTGSCHPQIDFTTYDLVIGTTSPMSSTSTATYTYRRLCETKQLQLQLLYHPGVTNDAVSLTYHALVPKLAPTETVQVEVRVK